MIVRDNLPSQGPSLNHFCKVPFAMSGHPCTGSLRLGHEHLLLWRGGRGALCTLPQTSKPWKQGSTRRREEVPAHALSPRIKPYLTLLTQPFRHMATVTLPFA